MTLPDRIKRWWAPAKWRDEHPEISHGEGFALGDGDRNIDAVKKPSLWIGRGRVYDARRAGRYGRR